MKTFTFCIFSFLALTENTYANMIAVDLKEYCDDRGGPGELICFGYIQGVLDTYDLLDSVFTQTHFGKGFLLCKPQNVPERAIAGLVDRFMQNNPEKLKFGAASIVSEALREAYPCPPKQ